MHLKAGKLLAALVFAALIAGVQAQPSSLLVEDIVTHYRFARGDSDLGRGYRASLLDSGFYEIGKSHDDWVFYVLKDSIRQSAESRGEKVSTELMQAVISDFCDNRLYESVSERISIYSLKAAGMTISAIAHLLLENTGKVVVDVSCFEPSKTLQYADMGFVGLGYALPGGSELEIFGDVGTGVGAYMEPGSKIVVHDPVAVGGAGFGMRGGSLEFRGDVELRAFNVGNFSRSGEIVVDKELIFGYGPFPKIPRSRVLIEGLRGIEVFSLLNARFSDKPMVFRFNNDMKLTEAIDEIKSYAIESVRESRLSELDYERQRVESWVFRDLEKREVVRILDGQNIEVYWRGELIYAANRTRLLAERARQLQEKAAATPKTRWIKVELKGLPEGADAELTASNCVSGCRLFLDTGFTLSLDFQSLACGEKVYLRVPGMEQRALTETFLLQVQPFDSSGRQIGQPGAIVIEITELDPENDLEVPKCA